MTQSQRTQDQSTRLTTTQEKTLCQRIQADAHDTAAQEQLLLANIGLVRSIANKKVGQGVDIDDLVQEGSFAFLKAIKTFDLGRNLRLSTYVTPKIAQAIQRYIENFGRLIRLPIYQQEVVRKLKHPHMQEGLFSPQRLQDVQRTMQQVISLDAPFNEENTVSIGEMLPDEENIEEIVLTQMISHDICQVLTQVLRPQELRIIRLRYGLDSEAESTLEEVAEQELLTKERVRQIQAKALSKLRLSPLTERLLA